MSRSTAKSVGLALAWSLAFTGCNQLEAIGTESGGTGGVGGVPPAVRAAFEGSCGYAAACHAAGGNAPVLAGDAIDDILTGQGSSGVPYVTLGDTANSYLAIVMMPDALLSTLGLTRTVPRMPADGGYDSPNNQTILAWIAGGEFEGAGTDGTGTGTDTDTGSSGTTAALEPNWTNVQAILDFNCSCHFLAPDMLVNGSFTFTKGMSHAELVDVKSPTAALDLIEPGDPAQSYLYLKMTGEFTTVPGSAGMSMPLGTSLKPEDLMLIEEWITAGALEN